MSSPILVTGAHRSGTTWVGKILSAGQEVAYISEPLNVHHRPGVFSVPTQHWYTYICENNQSDYLSAFIDTKNFNYHLIREILSLRSIKDCGRMVRDLNWFINGKLRNAVPLFKDPFAVFSAGWFKQALNCRVVILVRHPLPFVSSLKRLGWHFDFTNLLEQPLLMKDYLEPFRREMTGLLDEPSDVIAQGSLLWKMIYTVVDGFRKTQPDFLILRHEDLSRRPEEEYRSLFSSLNLAFTPEVQQSLIKSSRRGNPEELSTQKVHEVNLDSQANLKNWQNRLDEKEIQRIRELTQSVATKFYSDTFWE